jgi:hypothetical protein
MCGCQLETTTTSFDPISIARRTFDVSDTPKIISHVKPSSLHIAKITRNASNPNITRASIHFFNGITLTRSNSDHTSRHHSHEEQLGRRALVVLAAPGNIPDDGNGRKCDEHDRGVVHGCSLHRDVGRHAEERDGEKRPA